jgi:hypothetical protein
MKLSAEFKELIDQQESLEAKRTRVLMLLETSKSPDLHEQALLVLQMVLASQLEIGKALLVECTKLTCENVEWPVDIRA